MNKLKVGMYVRTEHFGIRKICNFISSLYEEFIEDEKKLCINKKDILKSSYNILDLIEEGDYLNELRVERNKYGELYTSYVYYGGDIGKQEEVYTTWIKEYKEEYKENKDLVRTILTKEQFESMEYEVENE